MEGLTKAFINATTKKLVAKLDNNFEIENRHPNNNNYVRVPHLFIISANYFENRRYNFEEHLRKMNNFLT